MQVGKDAAFCIPAILVIRIDGDRCSRFCKGIIQASFFMIQDSHITVELCPVRLKDDGFAALQDDNDAGEDA